MKVIKRNQGITLIALIITIILMLILAAVSITMAIDDGIFNYAEKAAGDTQKTIDDEQILVNHIMENYIKPNTGKRVHNWVRGKGEKIDTFTCAHCNVTYTMGQEVDYTAKGLASTTLSEDKSGLDTYIYWRDSYPDANNINQTNGEQTIEKQSTSWVVLGIEDTDEDGINETLLITTSAPVGATSDSDLWFYGGAGYCNVEEQLNRICEDLYSNNEYGLARSMKIEDVNSAFNFTPLGGLVYDDTASKYYTSGNLTTKLKELSAWEKVWDSTRYTPDYKNTKEILGKYILNGYWYEVTNGTYLDNYINDDLTPITELEKNTIFGKNTEYYYWLATCGMYGSEFDNSFMPYFGVGAVYTADEVSTVDSAYYVYDAHGGDGGDCLKLRPVVSLQSKLPKAK